MIDTCGSGEPCDWKAGTHAHVSAAEKKGRAAGAPPLVEAFRRGISSKQSTVRSARRPSARHPAGEHTRDTWHGGKGEACSGRVKARQQCSTSVDDESSAPLCGRAAATRGAEFRGGGHGGGAEIVGRTEHRCSRPRALHLSRSRRLHLVSVITRHGTLSQDGSVSSHQGCVSFAECAETLTHVSAHHLPDTDPNWLGTGPVT